MVFLGTSIELDNIQLAAWLTIQTINLSNDRLHPSEVIWLPEVDEELQDRPEFGRLLAMNMCCWSRVYLFDSAEFTLTHHKSNNSATTGNMTNLFSVYFVSCLGFILRSLAKLWNISISFYLTNNTNFGWEVRVEHKRGYTMITKGWQDNELRQLLKYFCF